MDQTQQSRVCFRTCPVSPARVVVKFTSEIIANPSGGSSGLGLRVVMNNLKFKETGLKEIEKSQRNRKLL